MQIPIKKRRKFDMHPKFVANERGLSYFTKFVRFTGGRLTVSTMGANKQWSCS